MLLSITLIFFSCFILSINGGYTDWGTRDTNRDHVPFLQGSLPGECPIGSKCRMMYLTFIVPEMSKIPPNGYNFNYDLLNCASLFSQSSKLILDGNNARFFIDIDLHNNSQRISPAKAMICFNTFLYADSAVIYSKSFEGVHEIQYDEIRQLPRILSTYDNFQIFHETLNNTRHFVALLEINFPRNGFTSADCCRPLIWHIGYGLIVYMEECKKDCKKDIPVNSNWSEEMETNEFVSIRNETSPNFKWNKNIYSKESSNPDSPLYQSSFQSSMMENVLVADIGNKTVSPKNGKDNEGTKSSDDEEIDYYNPFLFLSILYGILVLFVFGMLIGLSLIYADKKKKMKKEFAAKKDKNASIKVSKKESKKEDVFNENFADDAPQKPDKIKKESKKENVFDENNANAPQSPDKNKKEKKNEYIYDENYGVDPPRKPDKHKKKSKKASIKENNFDENFVDDAAQKPDRNKKESGSSH
uniref:CUB domain-containing protein n=1 Tax=Panagrolaimus sp. PS1159 TaxID=55785 RepID=A0AC35FLG6_9BILA